MTEFKEIALANNRGFCLVDVDDFDFINSFKWALSTRGYAQRCDGKKTVFMHRVINKTPEGLATDHINHNGLDNRKANLRTSNQSQNGGNRRPNRNTTSKYKGVCWCNKTKKWPATIKISKKLHHLGYYTNEDDAADAYDVAAEKYYGEFAFFNRRKSNA